MAEPLVLRDDDGRVRRLTLNRPDKLNAFDQALYRAAATALSDAAHDSGVAVVVLTGAGRAFSAGQDVEEMAALATGEDDGAAHGFPGFVDALAAFPKPLLVAVNGMALGIGATLLAFADLVFMSTEARIRLPFTDLAVAPEAASSHTFPAIMGRQHASWALLSSEWLPAEECRRAGLVWRVCEPEALLPETARHATVLAGKPLASLIETKRAMTAGFREAVVAARQREDAAFVRLLGQPANLEAFTALAEGRPPEFERVDAEHPVDLGRHLD